MKRDMDLIRELLLGIEAHPQLDGNQLIQYDDNENFGITDFPREQVVYHIRMLIDQGLIKGELTYGGPIISQLTWQGHDFLDAIRDPEIWQKTKDGAKKAGGFSLELLGDLAKGLIKKKIEEHTGVQL
jgi:hypothetical protein